MLLLTDGSESINLKGYTAIIPAIGVGNVGQLACDLIISTLNLKRIGNIWHPAIIPIVGPSAFDHDQTKAAACEIYADLSKQIFVLQLRSPLIAVHLNDFHEKLVEILQECSRVIVLTSSFGYEKHTIEASSFEYMANEEFKRNHSNKIEVVGRPEYSGEVVHGGGNAMKLYKALEAHNVPAVLLFKYVLEGDNEVDAAGLVAEVSQWFDSELKMSSSRGLVLRQPSSWKLLFGNDVGDLMF